MKTLMQQYYAGLRTFPTTEEILAESDPFDAIARYDQPVGVLRILGPELDAELARDAQAIVDALCRAL